MKENANPIVEQSSSRMKRKDQPVSYTKKLRSKITRRKRFQISAILTGSLNSVIDDKNSVLSAFPATSSSSSCFTSELSCTSTWTYDKLNNKPRSTRRKREIEEIQGFGAAIRTDVRSSRKTEKIPVDYNRRITRSYCRQKESERAADIKCSEDLGVELSESFCAESFSEAEAQVFRKTSDQFMERNSELKNRTQVSDNVEESEGATASVAISLSENSCIQPFTHQNILNLCKSDEFSEQTRKPKAENTVEIQGNEVSEISLAESRLEATNQNIYPSFGDLSEQIKKAPGLSLSEISRNNVKSDLAVTNLESTADQKPKDFDFDNSLACSEHLSFEEDSEYSTIHEMMISELESEFFPKIADAEFSDYTPSIFLESPSEFSEENSTPSLCFSLILQYKKQFSKVNSPGDIEISMQVQDEDYDEFTLLRFEDEEHEESYKKFRNRERKVAVHDYVEEYCSKTEYGNLVLNQRLLMVNWIVEQSSERELQSETMFLGVSLFDRFLSLGFFKNKRKLQVLGIACLTLATRIEENQLFNSVRQKSFHVGSNVYSRCEVVAMEWLVQKVLNFQCFLPTIYNFLWFYLKAARADAEVEERAKYLAMLSLFDHERLSYWPSTVAAGLVILASFAAYQYSSCQWVMETHVRTKKDDLPECIQSLEWLVKFVC